MYARRELEREHKVSWVDNCLAANFFFVSNTFEYSKEAGAEATTTFYMYNWVSVFDESKKMEVRTKIRFPKGVVGAYGSYIPYWQGRLVMMLNSTLLLDYNNLIVIYYSSVEKIKLSE